MKNKMLLLWCCVLWVLCLAWCWQKQQEQPQIIKDPNLEIKQEKDEIKDVNVWDKKDQIKTEDVWTSNAASEYCVKQWWTRKNEKDDQWNDYWVCQLKDWTSVDEWKYYNESLTKEPALDLVWKTNEEAEKILKEKNITFRYKEIDWVAQPMTLDIKNWRYNLVSKNWKITEVEREEFDNETSN